MNYERIYSELIFRAKNRTILPTEYKESHHILPKTMCPEYKTIEWNLVNLFPEEHLIAHLLLVKIYPENYKLAHAANMMTNGSNSSKMKRKIFNNKKYGWVRKKHSEAMKNGNYMKDLYQTDEEKYINHTPLREYWENITNEQREEHAKKSTNWKSGKNPFLGRKHTLEAKKKISVSNTGRKHTDVSIEKIREAGKGRIPSQSTRNAISKANSGACNGMAKSWKLISPHGEIHTFIGGLSKFLKNFNLPNVNVVKRYKGLGKIEYIGNIQSMKNLNGWEFI